MNRINVSEIRYVDPLSSMLPQHLFQFLLYQKIKCGLDVIKLPHTFSLNPNGRLLGRVHIL